MMEVIMKKLLILIVMLAPAVASAENLRMIIHGASYHQDREKPYNETNPGLGIGYGSDAGYIECGSYENSFYLNSKYCFIGGSFRVVGDLRAGVLVGYVSGYSEELRSAAIPYLQYKAVRLLIAPGEVAAIGLVFNIGD
jgi:hypothetical protein